MASIIILYIGATTLVQGTVVKDMFVRGGQTQHIGLTDRLTSNVYREGENFMLNGDWNTFVTYPDQDLYRKILHQGIFVQEA